MNKKKIAFYLWTLFFITSLISIVAIPMYMMDKIDKESKMMRGERP